MEPETAPGVTGEPLRVSRTPYLLVLQSGITTSVLALAGVYWLNKNTTDFHIMGLYANYVIPAGALIVGLVAGSGYGIASWLTGVRISRGLLWTVVLLQTGAYVGAEYIEYRDVRKQFEQGGGIMVQPRNFPSFLEYYDIKARNFAWKKEHGKGVGDPLGGWGYFFVLLGAAGFILGGLIAPAILFAVPYCNGCQRYMTRKVLGVLPAAVPLKKIPKKDTAAQEAHAREQEEAGVRADQALARLREAIATGNVEAFRAELSAAGSVKENNKLPRRVDVSLVWCRSCEGGRVALTLVSGLGGQMTQLKLGEATVPPEFVRAMVAQ
ncbi:MAG TPA: hypothetical protein VKD72_27215 [Gemmataceae bacterium]|nr:hypothetical protein [Gemmataceae bacterium]